MRRLDSQELQTVSGGDCYCCCWRNPPIKGFETIDIGIYNSSDRCRKGCDSWTEESIGFKECYSDDSQCGKNIGRNTLLWMLSSPERSLWLNPDLAHLSELVRQF